MSQQKKPELNSVMENLLNSLKSNNMSSFKMNHRGKTHALKEE